MFLGIDGPMWADLLLALWVGAMVLAILRIWVKGKPSHLSRDSAYQDLHSTRDWRTAAEQSTKASRARRGLRH